MVFFVKRASNGFRQVSKAKGSPIIETRGFTSRSLAFACIFHRVLDKVSNEDIGMIRDRTNASLLRNVQFELEPALAHQRRAAFERAPANRADVGGFLFLHGAVLELVQQEQTLHKR